MRTLVLAVLATTAAPAWATTAARVSLPALVTESDAVILGTAGASTSHWEGGRIVTRVPVTVEEVWAGTATTRVVDVVSLGGVVDDIGQNVSGAVRLAPGDRVVLCLKRRDDHYRVVEMSQGAFFVAPEASANPTVRRNAFGMRLSPPVGAALPTTLRALELAVREAWDARR